MYTCIRVYIYIYIYGERERDATTLNSTLRITLRDFQTSAAKPFSIACSNYNGHKEHSANLPRHSISNVFAHLPRTFCAALIKYSANLSRSTLAVFTYICVALLRIRHHWWTAQLTVCHEPVREPCADLPRTFHGRKMWWGTGLQMVVILLRWCSYIAWIYCRSQQLFNLSKTCREPSAGSSTPTLK